MHKPNTSCRNCWDGLADRLADLPMDSPTAERMGRFTQGVAHDFNNYLAAIVAFSESLLNSAVDQDHRILEQIRTTALKGTDVTQLMLIYSGSCSSGGAEIESVDLNELLRSMEQFLGVLIPDSVELRFELSIVPIWAEVNRVAIQEIIVNLLKVCRDLQHGKITGAITIKVSDTWSSNGSGTSIFGVTRDPGSTCLLEIIDSDEVLPFTGIKEFFEASNQELGLDPRSFSDRFFGNSSGAIELEDSESSCIRIVLPVAINKGTPSNISPAPYSPHIEADAPLDILVVDDDEAVLESLQLLLESLGYSVTPANSALAATQAMESRKDEIDCVILDYSMPQTNGLSLLNQFRSVGFNHPAILCSGYSMRIDDHPNAQFWPDEVLAKPFPVWQLQDAIRRACRNKPS